VKEGDVVAGKYRVERQIGSGGMGVVFAARHLQLDEPVALKFVAVDRAADREAVGRMMREARATFRLRSEHTVRVMDVGELPSGPWFIVMELLEGRDLKAELAARGPLPEKEVVQHALEACAALEEAHAAGIVHRDLKPHNLFLARSARGGNMVKVLDFGMSKLDPELFEAGPLTRPETALGTPRYMAPEQWKSAAGVDHRADIWALGVVMFELLTGEAPLSKLRGAERQARLLAGAIPTPRELRPEVSESVSRAIMRCLKADPDVRWPSVAHLATALRDTHPELAPPAERLDVTRTDVTVALPRDEMKRRVADAFAQQTEAQVVPVAPPTARETPLARNPEPVHRPDDFDLATEVRAPAFTPEEMESRTPPAPVAPEKPAGPKAHASTLRSAGTRHGLPEAVAAAPPTDKTLPMQGAPLPPPPAIADTAPLRAPTVPLPKPAAPHPAAAVKSPAPIAQPLAPPSGSGPAGPVLPPAPPRPPVPPRLDTRGIVLIVVGGLLSMLVAAVLAWIVVRSFGP
jgi:serine/threonine-protein kinase